MKINHLMKPHPTRRNQAWAVDFAVLDANSRPFVMIVVDVHTRLPLSATVTPGIAEDVTATLGRLGRRSGVPNNIWLDRGLHTRAIQNWTEANGISIACGPSPRIKAVTEPLLRDLRGYLHDNRFPALIELGHDIERWRQFYKTATPTVPNVNQ